MTLREAEKFLRDAGVEDARFDALELICHFENISRAKAMLCEFSSPELLNALHRRANGEPLQYILGEWEFMGIPFKVNEGCLIPRFDTEILCNYIIEKLPKCGTFADLCTGSGCIACSVLKHRPDSVGTAVELYPEPFKIAEENAKSLGVSNRLSLLRADACTDCLTGQFDIIASNPPYVTAEEMKHLSREVQKEPVHALTDGGDGLSVIRSIISYAPRHLKEGGSLAIEIGYMQGKAVTDIAEGYGLTCTLLRDTGDRDRVAVIKNS